MLTTRIRPKINVKPLATTKYRAASVNPLRVTVMNCVGIALRGHRLRRQGELRETHELAALERGFVRTQADAGPVRRAASVGGRRAFVRQSADELVDEMRMRAAVSRALGEAQMALFVVVDAPGGEAPDRLGQPVREVGHLDALGDLGLRALRGVQHMRLAL